MYRMCYIPYMSIWIYEFLLMTNVFKRRGAVNEKESYHEMILENHYLSMETEACMKKSELLQVPYWLSRVLLFPWLTLFSSHLCEMPHIFQNSAYVSCLNEVFLDCHPLCYIPFNGTIHSSPGGVLTMFNSHFHITFCNTAVWCVISCMSIFPTDCKQPILLSFRFPAPGTGLGTPASAQSKCVEWMNPVQGRQAGNSKTVKFFCDDVTW